MVKKIFVDKNIEEIRDCLKRNTLIIGSNLTTKMLKQGKIGKVFMAINCPKEIKQDLMHYTHIGKVELVELDLPNVELGTICKKQFAISVVSVPKGA